MTFPVLPADRPVMRRLTSHGRSWIRRSAVPLPLEDPVVTEFLATRRTAIIATNRPHAAPQLSPIWFLWAADRFIFSAGAHTAKTANIRRDPLVTLCIDDEPTARYFVASGRAVLVDEPAVRDHAIELIGKYKPAAEVVSYWEHLEIHEPQLLFTLRPERTIWRAY